MSGNPSVTARRFSRGSRSAAFGLQIQASRLLTIRNLLLLFGMTLCLAAAGCMQRRISSGPPLWPAVGPTAENAQEGEDPVDEVVIPAVKLSPHVHPEKPHVHPDKKVKPAASFQIRGQSPQAPPAVSQETASEDFLPKYPRFPMRISSPNDWIRYQSPQTTAPPAVTEPVPAGPGGDAAGVEPLGDLFLQPPGTADLDIFVEEARTGRFMFGAGVNSNAGLTGHIVIDERNFDILRFPTSFQDFLNGTAFRGGGQGLRIEAVPGTLFERYVVNFTEPYLLWTPFSLNVSGFLFERRYEDWSERRKGARVGLGYRITHDLSINASLRMAEVDIYNPSVEGVAELDAMVGDHDLYGGRVTLAHDTRDIPFLPTQGHLLELSFEQMFGSFDYPRGNVDYRQYFLVRERADGSNRHTLSFSTRLGVSGAQTPIFENFFAGGQSTIRGFDFRGASPVVNGVTVGGEFMMLGTVEYMFPLTADDMLKGVFFVDAGTVEEDVEINGDNFRVSPGFGLRISIPALGPAPLAFDFAFPVAHAPYDDIEHFSFFFGFGR